MTTKATGWVGVLSFAMLAACTKSVPPEQPVAQGPAPPPAEEPAEVVRDKHLAELLALLDTAPQCETFRTQLKEAAGQVPADQPLPEEVIRVISRAHEADCTRKRR